MNCIIGQAKRLGFVGWLIVVVMRNVGRARERVREDAREKWLHLCYYVGVVVLFLHKVDNNTSKSSKEKVNALPIAMPFNNNGNSFNVNCLLWRYFFFFTNAFKLLLISDELSSLHCKLWQCLSFWWKYAIECGKRCNLPR